MPLGTPPVGGTTPKGRSDPSPRSSSPLSVAALPVVPPLPSWGLSGDKSSSPARARSPAPDSGKPEEPARYITELPPLSEATSRSQGAVLAGDWMAAIKASMTQLSPSATQWWRQITEDATALYARWLSSSPQERLGIKADSLPSRSEGRMALVEQRAVTLLLKSVPESFRQELISNRILSCSGIIYRIHQKWQPGGALEKAQLLQFLVQPLSLIHI